MLAEYERILAKSQAKSKEIHRQMLHLSKFNRSGFDKLVASYHEEVFQNIDCMQCANCCRQTGPRFRDKDLKILAKETCLTPKEFTRKYLKPDIDINFFVLEKLPCPFLCPDNACSVYEKRPLSCEEYPHTNTSNIQRHLVRLGYSAMVCPAAALIVERILEEY